MEVGAERRRSIISYVAPSCINTDAMRDDDDAASASEKIL